MRFRPLLLLILAAVLIVAVAPACNTLRGAGKDVERAGEKIQEITH